MELTNEQRQSIFEEAQQIIDEEIKENGYFDDTMTNGLEDIILDLTFITIGKQNFDKYLHTGHGQYNNIENTPDYDKIIDLTTDFLTWLFNTNCYDKGYYENMCYIRLKI